MSFLTPLKQVLCSFVRGIVLSRLSSAIRVGCLIVREGSASSTFGKIKSGVEPVIVTVRKEMFWLKIFTSTDIAFGEAYMYGDIEINDLAAMMQLWVNNRHQLEYLPNLAQRISQRIAGMLRSFLGTTWIQSRWNAVVGYDTSNDLFEAFLSKEMMYSCPIWSDAEGGVSGDLCGNRSSGDLEAAQLRKIHMVIDQARIKKGDRVLEFGTGWGGFAIEAVRATGCTVDTVTLSAEQKKLADERIQKAGLQDSITVHFMDYRDVPSHFGGKFDVFISIEMLEHVGPLHYEQFFRIVDWALKSDVGSAVITSTTRPETRFTWFQPHDFARKYFWPNGSLPSASVLIETANRASMGRLTLQNVMNHGPHYPRALREWSRRFEENVTDEVINEVREDRRRRNLPDLEDVEVFKRKWQFLFMYAAAGYVPGYVGCHVLTFTREANVLDR